MMNKTKNVPPFFLQGKRKSGEEAVKTRKGKKAPQKEERGSLSFLEALFASPKGKQAEEKSNASLLPAAMPSASIKEGAKDGLLANKLAFVFQNDKGNAQPKAQGSMSKVDGAQARVPFATDLVVERLMGGKSTAREGEEAAFASPQLAAQKALGALQGETTPQGGGAPSNIKEGNGSASLLVMPGSKEGVASRTGLQGHFPWGNHASERGSGGSMAPAIYNNRQYIEASIQVNGASGLEIAREIKQALEDLASNIYESAI